MTTPSFADPALREAAEKHANAIAGFTNNLDSVSADIKALEEWLRKSGICLPIVMAVSENFEPSSQVSWGLEPENSGGQVVTTQIAWELHTNDQWRLLFVRKVATGRYFDGYWDADNEHVERRPLIEVPARLRLELHAKLPQLLATVAETIDVRRIQIPE